MISTFHNQNDPCKVGLFKSQEIIEKSYTNGGVQCSIYVCIWMYAELNTIAVICTSYRGMVIHRLVIRNYIKQVAFQLYNVVAV